MFNFPHDVGALDFKVGFIRTSVNLELTFE